jgi:hypothetical protein
MRLKLPTMAQVNAKPRAEQKGAAPTRKAEKAKAGRAEGKVKGLVRAHVAARDGACRIGLLHSGDSMVLSTTLHSRDLACDGPSEWAHLAEKRRSKTRGQAPEVRHTTADSLILCRRHHARYDGRERPRLEIEALSARGADGPLRFKERA